MVVSSKPGKIAVNTIAEKKISDGVNNLIKYLENVKLYEDQYWEPTNPRALNRADFHVSPEGVAVKWPGQLNYSVETPDENIAIIKVKGFEYAPSTVNASDIFYTIDTSDVNYVLDKLQSGVLQEFLWEQAQDAWISGKEAVRKFGINLPVSAYDCEFYPDQNSKCIQKKLFGKHPEFADTCDPFACRHTKIDYDAAGKELESIKLKHVVPLYLKRCDTINQIENTAIPNGGAQNETLAHTVARQKQLEDILSFASPENVNEMVELFCVYAGEDRVEEKDARNILQWYYDTIGESVTPNTKEKKMVLIPTLLKNMGALRLRTLHNTIDRLSCLDPKNEYALAAHAALEDLESIANAKGADTNCDLYLDNVLNQTNVSMQNNNESIANEKDVDLVNNDDAKDAARAIWANTILYLRDIYHKRSEVDQAKSLWNSYDPESDSGIVKFFQAKAESGEGNETLHYKHSAKNAKRLQETHNDFPYSELSTALTFRKVSETSPKAAAKFARLYERAKEKFMDKYPGDKPDIFAISTSKDYTNIIVGDGRNYVSLPVKDVKTAKAIADILPYYSGAKHVEGAPDLGQYFSN